MRFCLILTLLALPGFALSGCTMNQAISGVGMDTAMFRDRALAPAGVLRLRYRTRLGLELEGSLEPLERSSPTLVGERELVLVGNSTGWVNAFDAAGAARFSIPVRAPIHAPILSVGDAIYFGSDEGWYFGYRGPTNLFRVSMPGPVAGRAIHRDGLIYLATETNQALCLDATTGEILWTYARELPEGFATGAHASVTVHDDTVFVAFSDGTVNALHKHDGTLRWQFDSAAELDGAGTDGEQSFRVSDSDATPLFLNGTLYVASQLGGLYALVAENGAVLWHREEYTGVVGISQDGERLILASGAFGVAAVEKANGDLLWSHRIRYGAPSPVTVVPNMGVGLVAESRGAVVALNLADGTELDRYEDGHGFSSEVAYDAGIAAALSNAGTLFVFAIGTPPVTATATATEHNASSPVL